MSSAIERYYGGGAIVSQRELGFPVSTSAVSPRIRSEVEKYGQLPATISRDGVVKEVEEASRMEGGAKLLQRYAQARIRKANALANMYQTHANLKTGMMRVSERFANTDARFGKAVLDFGLGMATQKAELDGYDQAFQSAQTLFE
jgi:hypothetical protein